MSATGARLSGRLTMVAALGLASAREAGTVHSTTRKDPELKRWVTTGSDHSEAVTRDDRALRRWNSTITPAPGQESST